MKKHCCIAGTFFLIGTLAVAQGPQSKTLHPRDASSGQASGRQDQYGHASGMTSQTAGRKSGEVQSADFPRSSSARNTDGEMSSVKSNPLYKDSGKSGTNPLYEGKSLANAKPGAGASAAPYKDPEDMTTRYRAGNNKTTRGAGDNTASTANPQATGLAHKKHVAGVKYEDRTAPTQSNPSATSGGPSKVDSFSVKQ